MLDSENLRCFEAAAVRLNFRAAANQVGLSPAAFSERIRRLEDNVGAVLFARTTRRVKLTPAGERFLPQARRTLAELQRCSDLLREGGPAPYELTIGTRFELGMSWVLPEIEAQISLRPEQRLHLYFSEGPAIVSALLGGTIDAMIGSMRLVSPRLRTLPLHEERYCFVGAPDLLKDTPLTEPEHAARHTLVDISPSQPLTRYWRDRVPPDERWQFGSHQYMGAIAPIRQWVVSGRGVAVLPEYFVLPDIKAGRLEGVLTHIQPRSDWFRLVWLENHLRSAELEAFGQFLRNQPLR
jgi:LysR family transcriptional regulator, glycine cleavage system transcriptional activator